MDSVVNEQHGGEYASNFDNEHDGILDHAAGIELAYAIYEGATDDFSVPETLFFSHGDRFASFGLG
jgi:hypothetical protein